jgi:hypothetical protein
MNKQINEQFVALILTNKINKANRFKKLIYLGKLKQQSTTRFLPPKFEFS